MTRRRCSWLSQKNLLVWALLKLLTWRAWMMTTLTVGFHRRVRDHALVLREGWASLVNIGPKIQVQHVTVARPAASPPLMSGYTPSSTSKALLSASASFTRRVIIGKRVIKPAAVLKQNSVASKASSDMINALAKVHSVFSRFATRSPRFRSLRLDSAPVLDPTEWALGRRELWHSARELLMRFSWTVQRFNLMCAICLRSKWRLGCEAALQMVLSLQPLGLLAHYGASRTLRTGTYTFITL